MQRSFVNNNGILSVASALDVQDVKGMGITFFELMLENRDQIAQIDAFTGEKETWGQILQKSIRTAITMRSRGIASKDIVSICSFNNLNSCVPLIASFFLNVKTANLDPTISLPDTTELLKQIQPKMIFAGPEAVELIEDALRENEVETEIVVFGESENHSKFSEFLQSSPEEKSFLPVEVENVEDTAVIFFSSGTTGLPKGICLSHYGLLGPNTKRDKTNRLTELIILIFASSYWISSLKILLYSLLEGAVRLVYPKFDPDKAWNLIKVYKVNMMFTAPSQIIAMCKNGRPEHADTSSLKVLALGGGPISKEQMIEIRKLFNGSVVWNLYGQTETSGYGFTWTLGGDDLRLMLENPDSVGRPTPGCFYKIVNPETEEILGINQKGELRIKTEFCMNGYHNLDSSAAWDADGFIKTGDIAYYDVDCCFYIVDRLKEMLKFQSWHVIPTKLEAVLLTHAAVKAAVVFGIPHPEDGDHPMGLVTLKELFINSVTEQELEKYVEQRVDERQKLRGGVKVVRNIPANPNGKYNRRRIRDLVLSKEI